MFAPLRDTLLTGGDHYMHLADLRSYLEADRRLLELYGDPEAWTRKAILNIARIGQVLERSHHRGVRGRDLGRQALSGAMSLSPLAGKPAPPDILVDLTALERAYYDRRPAMEDPAQRVSFGTSGHRGSSLRGSFNEAHILAVTQAICEYRRAQGTDGPLYMGKDTHALSGPAQRSALEVLAANGVETIIQRDDGVTPTPVISRAILAHNRGRTTGRADGIVVTPSHNPPADGGFKYNPPHGGPADTDATGWIQARANALLEGSGADIRRMPIARAFAAPTTHRGRSRAAVRPRPSQRRRHGCHP